ncbi:MAG: carboxy terminal-processing peptidase [Ginsengibacter sp.]
MSKRFLTTLTLLISIGLIITFTSMGRGDKGNDNPKSKNEKILRNVGIVLEEGHYSPKKIDDNFSKEVLYKYLSDIDPDRYIFYQKDIDGFKKFETKIDDEIHGTAPLESFYAISTLYTTRLNEVSKEYSKYLNTPFTFNSNDSIELDGTKRHYPVNEKERQTFSMQRIKYLVLSKYSDLLEEKEKNKSKKDFVVKADTSLEREARQKVAKQMDRYFSTLKAHNTPEDLFSEFVNAITGQMDPHTNYFAPVEKRSFDELISGTFYGIGAQLKEEDGKIKIASLITGGPAWKSGNIKINDEILKIAQGKGDPVDVTGYAVTDAVKLIRGSEKNSEVRLTIKKVDGTIHTVPIIRDKINLEETFAKSAIINGEHKIGYIYLPEFYANFEDPNGRRCATDVAKELEKLKEEHVEGVIMDLRNNGGGSLNDVVDMAGLFIEDGPICQVKGRDEKTMILRDRDRNILYSGPLAVMVDELSASASEIFAAAIQDYKRGVIIGSTSTYGKGTVQRTISLDPEAENPLFNKVKEGLGDIKLTFRKFYRINGGATQLRGVVPDIVIPDRLETFKPLRERDNPSALKWDEISKADYKPWNNGFDLDRVIKNENELLKNNNSFSTIRKDVDWLKVNVDKTYSLNLQKFRVEQKQLRNIYKQMDDVSKLPVPLTVKNIAADLEGIKMDSDRVDRNKQFLKRIGDDIYINESVRVVNDMIGQAAIAKAGK